MIDIIKISLIAYMFCALGEEGKIFHFYQKALCNLPKWLCKPLGGCFMCFTGQVCLWYFIITKPLNVIELLFFCSAGIMMSMIWNRLYQFLKI